MRTRCTDCGLAFDDSHRELDCPHSEMSDSVSTSIQFEFLADATLTEV